MATYLLTWNPKTSTWDDYEDLLPHVQAGEGMVLDWSTGQRKHGVSVGHEFYLLVQGDGTEVPRGLIGSGVFASEPRKARRGYGEGVYRSHGNLAEIVFTVLLRADQVLPRSRLDEPPLDQVRWNTQGSGIQISDEVAEELGEVWQVHLETVGYPLDAIRRCLGDDEECFSAEADAEEYLQGQNWFDPESVEEARDRILLSIVQRRGQADFRAQLLEAYEDRCAITGCDAVEALEAAHVTPYRGEETNHPQNGLLLRADVHTLFDRGLLAIDSDNWTVILEPSLRETTYGPLHGKALRLPEAPQLRPSVAAVDEQRRLCEF